MLTVRDFGPALVGPSEFAQGYPHQLSGGMAQRALVNDPALLILDEPLGKLDSLTRLAMQTELAALWQRAGLSVLMVTHDVEEALFMAQRVLVMGPRPARVLAELRVDLPYPRHRGDEALARRPAPFAFYRPFPARPRAGRFPPTAQRLPAQTWSATLGMLVMVKTKSDTSATMNDATFARLAARRATVWAHAARRLSACSSMKRLRRASRFLADRLPMRCMESAPSRSQASRSLSSSIFIAASQGVSAPSYAEQRGVDITTEGPPNDRAGWRRR